MLVRPSSSRAQFNQRAPQTQQQRGNLRRGHSPLFPSLLQWNVNGLRTRLPELRQSLTNQRVDVLALQETNVLPGEVRLSPYVIYYSAAINPNGRSRVAVFVRADVHHAPLNLSDLCSPYEEYAGVTVRMGKHETTIVSAYVTPQSTWNTKPLEEIHKRSRGNLIICGDFNAHNETWGGTLTDARGRQIETTTTMLNLRALNDGSATFCRRGVKATTIDITLVSPEIDALWTAEPDTGGSDHFPISVKHPSAAPRDLKVCKVVNWDLFRQHLDTAMQANNGEDLTNIIAQCLRNATRTVMVPVTRPTPELE